MTDETKGSLKSSYDLAMGRFGQQGGQVVALSAEQKKAIAEVERKTKAKIAELEIMLHSQLARSPEDADKIEELRNRHQSETVKIRNKAEEEKERIRQEKCQA